MTMADCDNHHHFYNNSEECSEIHTIQIFREAKDVDDDSGPGTAIVFPSPSSPVSSSSSPLSANDFKSTSSTTFHGNAGTGLIAGGTYERLADAVAPTGSVEPGTASETPTFAIEGGIGDDHAVLDTDVAFSAVAASNSPYTTTTMTIDSTSLHNGKEGGANNFYSFFFDDDDDATEQAAAQHDGVQQSFPSPVNIVDYEETIKENMDVVAIDGRAGTADGSDDFSITSQDTDSSPEDWMDLDLDENILRDATSFWEHGLATSVSSFSTTSGTPPDFIAAEGPHTLPVYGQNKQHVRRISVLDRPLR